MGPILGVGAIGWLFTDRVNLDISSLEARLVSRVVRVEMDLRVIIGALSCVGSIN